MESGLQQRLKRMILLLGPTLSLRLKLQRKARRTVEGFCWWTWLVQKERRTAREITIIDSKKVLK